MRSKNEGHSQKEKQKEDDLFSPLSRFNQKRKLQNKKTSKFTWNVEVVEAVIIEWENHPVLFNASHPQYYIKDKGSSQKSVLNRYNLKPFQTMDKPFYKFQNCSINIKTIPYYLCPSCTVTTNCSHTSANRSKSVLVII